MIDLIIIVENGRVTDVLSDTADEVSVLVLNLDTTDSIEQRVIAECLENIPPAYKNVY